VKPRALPSAIHCQKRDKKTVLAVDDAAFFLNILKKYVSGTGHKLICVNSGDAALKYLVAHDPDLFILDIEMPEMNGYELAQKIRNEGKKAPIIFLTGNAKREDVVKARNCWGTNNLPSIIGCMSTIQVCLPILFRLL
jgi:CheY-like chemotaxis protein